MALKHKRHPLDVLQKPVVTPRRKDITEIVKAERKRIRSTRRFIPLDAGCYD